MATQQGVIKLQGTIAGINYYNTQDGHLARRKTGVDANRIANDPKFQRSRENAAEFGRASKAGKLLRTALRTLLLNSSDNRMDGRLNQSMLKVIQADTTNERGLRSVMHGQPTLLTGFEFNTEGKLATILLAPYTVTIDRLSGEISIEVPSFLPSEMITAPTGATHFKILSAAAEIDFNEETFVVKTTESNTFPCNASTAATITQTNRTTPNTTKPIFVALGLVFYQEINEVMYPLKNGAHNPSAIVQVDTGI